MNKKLVCQHKPYWKLKHQYKLKKEKKMEKGGWYLMPDDEHEEIRKYCRDNDGRLWELEKKIGITELESKGIININEIPIKRVLATNLIDINNIKTEIASLRTQMGNTFIDEKAFVIEEIDELKERIEKLELNIDSNRGQINANLDAICWFRKMVLAHHKERIWFWQLKKMLEKDKDGDSKETECKSCDMLCYDCEKEPTEVAGSARQTVLCGGCGNVVKNEDSDNVDVCGSCAHKLDSEKYKLVLKADLEELLDKPYITRDKFRKKYLEDGKK